MRRIRASLVLFFAVLLLATSFSLVRGANPITVQNVANMHAPYSTGSINFDTAGWERNVQAAAEYEVGNRDSLRSRQFKCF